MSGPRIAVLKGGFSPEREVSLVSGAAAAKALRERGAEAIEIDAGRDLAAALAEAKPDIVFNALHGRWGEDGCVQGLLEWLGLPYTHSGVLASSLAMDKERAKAVFRQNGLKVPDGRIVSRAEAAAGHAMEPPYVVKPNDQGSSVGVFIVRRGDNRPPAALAATDWDLGETVLVETFVPGRELTVSVLGDRPLAVTEIVAHTDFYDYEAKYAAGGSSHEVPAKIPAGIERACLDMAKAAHDLMGCRGLTRSDFRWDDAKPGTEGLYLLEINTQPGLTPTSLSPEQAEYVGMSFSDLCWWMIEDASCPR
ncbi:MAG: D-alanine--D-alanine ligase [Pseudomonadota bacterium]